MRIVLTDLYHQATQRFLTSLERASIDYKHINIVYDGFLPTNILNPFAAAIGASDMPDKPLHYNEIVVPELYEIRNENGNRAEILNGDSVVGYVNYAPNTPRLVREVVWLDYLKKPVIVHRYNRQGFKFADGLFNFEGKEVKTIYYHATGDKVLTIDTVTRAIISEVADKSQIFSNLTEFVTDYIRKLPVDADEIVFNSMSTPFFVSNVLRELPGTLYFQEKISDKIPGNMKMILEGKTPTKRILFENVEELKKVEKLAEEKRIKLDYLGAIETFARKNVYRPRVLTITRSDQIIYDEAIANLLSEQGAKWTIAAPTEVSEKLRGFANNHDSVNILETISSKNVNELLSKNDIYLDVNNGSDYENSVRRAYLEGLLVLGAKSFAKDEDYELVFETEQEIIDILKQPDKQIAMQAMREKRGKRATVEDYRRCFNDK